MALREQTAARLVGFDELGATMQISTLEAIEADLRRAERTFPRAASERVSRRGTPRETATD